MYINESEAKEDIENLLVAKTNDYQIYPVRRKRVDAKVARVFFAAKVVSKKGEESLFYSLSEELVNNDEIHLLESEEMKENSTQKEIFLFACEINIFGI